MNIAFVSLFGLLVTFLPIILAITVIVMVMKFMNRYEQRANERLELERQVAARQQEQFNVLVERLDQIEEKMETRP
ncbi:MULTISPECIES: hypothetical protein [unclassified Exiguobacterium]|uniref:hypothetical protein n=1 Tax=unclassified Exiguobacterium TaxID=2644629 RepID=UPI00103D1CAD|nr:MULTISPECIES: hypothetical protein [unclassified Exiguobacterium]TCI67464.1 hypothetical protein EVJ19_12950 [Exiguobacterium sp. IPCI3]TCI76802.1 hypothetical protein EVJ18_12940 [Exiguobacterium sp. IPCH1]TCI78547.1 hypothetical protein EVJ17_12940 [Exiguobacterium sp. IPBC4]